MGSHLATEDLPLVSDPDGNDEDGESDAEVQGSSTAEEWTRRTMHIGDQIKQQFQEADTNHDGKISKDELANIFEGAIVGDDLDYMFAALDVNRDGFIDYQEF